MPELGHMHYLAISHVCPISGAVLPALLGLDLPQNAKKYCNVIILCSQLIRTSPPSAEIHTIGNGIVQDRQKYDNGVASLF